MQLFRTKKSILAVLLILIIGFACEKNIDVSPDVNWRSMKISQNQSQKQDPFKSVCAVVAADLAGAVTGGKWGSLLGPWGGAAGAILLGGVSSYGAHELVNSSATSGKSWPNSNSHYLFDAQFFSHESVNPFDQEMIVHNELLVEAVNSMQNNNTYLSKSILYNVMEAALLSSDINISSGYPSFTEAEQHMDANGRILHSTVTSLFEDPTDDVWVAYDVYRTNLLIAGNYDDFITYSLAFENSISTDPNLLDDDRDLILRLCSLTRSSATYWINQDL